MRWAFKAGLTPPPQAGAMDYSSKVDVVEVGLEFAVSWGNGHSIFASGAHLHALGLASNTRNPRPEAVRDPSPAPLGRQRGEGTTRRIRPSPRSVRRYGWPSGPCRTSRIRSPRSPR
jgi:hypothetical protein